MIVHLRVARFPTTSFYQVTVELQSLGLKYILQELLKFT